MIKSLEECRNKKFLELLSWWEKACPGKGLPLRSQFEPLDYPKLWPQLFICGVFRDDNNKMKFIFRYAGGYIERAFGISCTGKSIDHPFIENSEHLTINQFEECVEERRPIYCRHSFVTKNLREVEFERILFPLSSKGDTVDYILGAYEFSKTWDYRPRPW